MICDKSRKFLVSDTECGTLLQSGARERGIGGRERDTGRKEWKDEAIWN
jgi:hypothetical protein